MIAVKARSGSIRAIRFLTTDNKFQDLYKLECEKIDLTLTIKIDSTGLASTVLLRPWRDTVKSARDIEVSILSDLESWQNNPNSKWLVIGTITSNVSNIKYFKGISDTTQNLTEHSIFEIGSISKPITGIILHSIIEEGLMGLNSPVNHFLPREIKLPLVKGQEVLIRHLVTHTACFPRLPENFAPTSLTNPNVKYSEIDLLDYLNNIKLDCDIGVQSNYSNLSAGLLGYLLSKVSGLTYDDMIYKYIAKPLELTSFGILSDEMNWTVGHDMFGRIQERWHFPSVFTSAGGVDASVHSMEKLLFNLINSDSTTLIGRSIESSKKTLNKGIQEIATFWFKNSINGKTVYWHNGLTGGYNSFIGWLEGSKSGVFILSNNFSNISTSVGLKYLEKYCAE